MEAFKPLTRLESAVARDPSHVLWTQIADPISNEYRPGAILCFVLQANNPYNYQQWGMSGAASNLECFAPPKVLKMALKWRLVSGRISHSVLQHCPCQLSITLQEFPAFMDAFDSLA